MAKSAWCLLLLSVCRFGIQESQIIADPDIDPQDYDVAVAEATRTVGMPI